MTAQEPFPPAKPSMENMAGGGGLGATSEPDSQPLSQERLIAEITRVKTQLGVIRSIYVDLAMDPKYLNRCVSLKALCDEKYWDLLHRLDENKLQRKRPSSAPRKLRRASTYLAVFKLFRGIFEFSTTSQRLLNELKHLVRIALDMAHRILVGDHDIDDNDNNLQILLEEITRRLEWSSVGCISGGCQFLLYLVLFVFLFRRFAGQWLDGAIRTMPWSISTSLAVLWGVFWMFYSESGTSDHWAPHQRRVEFSHQEEHTHDPLELWDSPSAIGLSPQMEWPAANELLLTGLGSETVPLLLDPADVESLRSDEVFVSSMVNPTIMADFQTGQAQPDGFCVVVTESPSISEPGSPSLLPAMLSQAPMPTPKQRQTKQPSQSSTHSILSRGIRHVSGLGTSPARWCTSKVSKTRGTNFSSGSFLCPDCGKAFTRMDALKRHLTEQNPAREYLCPTAGCQRSRVGSGFKRQSHVREHFKTCRDGSRLDSQLATGNLMAESPMPPPMSEDISNDGAEPAHYTGPDPSIVRAEAANEGPAERSGRRLTDADKIASLEACYRAEEEELLAHDEEGRRRRERLEHLRGLIEMFKGDAGGTSPP